MTYYVPFSVQTSLCRSACVITMKASEKGANILYYRTETVVRNDEEVVQSQADFKV